MTVMGSFIFPENKGRRVLHGKTDSYGVFRFEERLYRECQVRVEKSGYYETAGDIESFIVETQVECIPLEALFERNSVVHIDLLLIDVEGYDFEVLKQLPTQSIRPTVVIYEQQCLGKDIPDAKQFMTGLGYACFECGGDVIAVWDDGSEISTKLLKRLRNLFRRVQP